jgi:hypothetical protein
MAYSKAPTNDTYSSPRIPVAYGIAQRDGFSNTAINQRPDEGLVNTIPIRDKNDKDGTETMAQLRLPIVGQEITGSTGLVGQVRGVYVWEYGSATTAPAYFVDVGDSVFRVTGTAPGTFVKIITWTTTNKGSDSPVGFTEFIDGSNTKSLIIVDGVEGYSYASTLPATATKITDVDFPTPHAPYPIYLDGYLFLAKKDTGDIYNSDLNSPTTWTAGSFISSEIYPDNIKALMKINNYLVAVGANGCEYFYDAANASGSPLARYEGAVLPFGLAFPNSIAVNKNRACMLANMNDGEPAVVVIEDLKYKDITPPWLVNFISKVGPSINVYGYFIRQYGHMLYCVNVGAATFAYDFDTELWVEFAYGSNTSLPIYYTAFSPSYAVPTTFFAANAVGTGTNGFFGSLGNSIITSGIYQNDGYDALYISGAVVTSPITMVIRTPRLTFGTNNSKTMSRFVMQVECASPSTGVPATVSWLDNDWEMASAQSVTKTFTPNDNWISQLGMFRSRAFSISLGGVPYSFRVRWIEMDINKGQQ